MERTTRFSAKRHRLFSFLVAALMAGMMVATSGLQAQVTSGAISGIAKDETGAVMPGVSVTATQVETGLLRTVVSDDQGRYKIPELPVGEYTVQAELSGFQTTVRSGIKLTIGREAVVDLALKVGEISDKLVVTGDAPLVETTQATLASLVDDKKIRDLPLNGRDIAQLAFLNEGVIQARNTGGNTQSGNQGVKVSIAGTRQHQTAFLVDGTDIRGNWSTTPAGASGLMLGVETIREFKVVTGAFSSEYGRFSGGVITAVTKSGTNEIHGSAFEFLRNSAMDARNFFDRIPNPPPFKRNQFGANLGGPIIKNRSFFFGSYEAFRERLTTTSTARVPTALARQGILPTGGNVTVNPRVTPYLAMYPLPNGQDRGDGTADYIFGINRPVNEDYFAIKVDHQISDNDSLFVRYTYDNSDSAASAIGPTGTGREYLTQYLTISEKKIFSPSLINDFRFGFTRNKNLELTVEQFAVSPSLFFGTNVPYMGTISAAPLTGIGSGAGRQVWPNLFQYLDDVSYTRGAHSLKMGVAVSRFQTNEASETRAYGAYTFLSFRDFLLGNARTFDGFNTPRHIAGLRQSLFGFFLQDDYRFRPNLTVNLGIRYEFITSPTEVAGRLANVDSLTQTTARVGNPFFKNPSLKNFAPRVGFAWDPKGNGKTSVRGGFGVFFDQVLPYVYDLAGAGNPPWRSRITIQPPDVPTFPNPYERGLSGFNNALLVILPPNQPYIMQYSLNLQQEILPQTVLLLGYQGSRGVHLPRYTDGNQALGQLQPDGRKFFLPVCATGQTVGCATRRNTAFGQMRTDVFDASSFYNSLRVSLNRRFNQGMQFQVSYNFSKAVDDSSNAGIWDGAGQTVGAFSLDPDNAQRDRGLSSWDIRHYFVANFTYDIPFGKNMTGFARQLLGDWEINGIVTASSGAALNLIQGSFDQARSQQFEVSQRPDLRAGANNNPVLRDGRDPNKYFDPNAFAVAPLGYFGNLARNTLIGPGVATFDFVVKKTFAIDEARRIQFRSEFFNLFNRANFGTPGQSVFSAPPNAANPNGVVLSTAGQITSTSTTSRQIQFGLRFEF